MIRKIQPTRGLSGGGQSQQCLVRRKWVPVTLAIQDTGEYLVFRQKLSHTAVKVVGIIMTSDTPWEDEEEEDI